MNWRRRKVLQFSKSFAAATSRKTLNHPDALNTLIAHHPRSLLLPESHYLQISCRTAAGPLRRYSSQISASKSAEFSLLNFECSKEIGRAAGFYQHHTWSDFGNVRGFSDQSETYVSCTEESVNLHRPWRNVRWTCSASPITSQRFSISTKAPLGNKEGQSSSPGSPDTANLKETGSKEQEQKATETSTQEKTQQETTGSSGTTSEAEDQGARLNFTANHVTIGSRSPPGLGGFLLELWSNVKMRTYLWLHRAHLEKSFDEKQFLDEAGHAFKVVNELFGKGEFDAMANMVAPRVLGAFQEAYTQTLGDCIQKGFTAEHVVNSVDEARLVDFEFVVEKDERTGYNLKSLLPDLDNYHNDVFLVFSVRMLAEIETTLFKNGKVVKHDRTKEWHTIKFARQVPKVATWHTPAEELESPWYLVDFRG